MRTCINKWLHPTHDCTVEQCTTQSAQLQSAFCSPQLGVWCVTGVVMCGGCWWLFGWSDMLMANEGRGTIIREEQDRVGRERVGRAEGRGVRGVEGQIGEGVGGWGKA